MYIPCLNSKDNSTSLITQLTDISRVVLYESFRVFQKERETEKEKKKEKRKKNK